MLRLLWSATAVQNKCNVTNFGGALPDLCCFKAATGIAGSCKDLDMANNSKAKSIISYIDQSNQESFY